MPIRKDKPIGNVLGANFSWSGLLDATADVYAGVSFRHTYLLYEHC